MQGRWRHWMLLKLYRAAFTLAICLFVILFPLWLFTAKRRATLFKRLGWQPYPQSKPSSGKPVWIHALSIGELLSAGSLIQSLRRELGDRPLYLSVSTASAFAMAQARFSLFCNGMFYFPYDVAFAVDRCIDAVDPALIVLVETDIWPRRRSPETDSLHLGQRTPVPRFIPPLPQPASFVRVGFQYLWRDLSTIGRRGAAVSGRRGCA